MSLCLASLAWLLALLTHIDPEGRTKSFVWAVYTNYATDKPRERLRNPKAMQERNLCSQCTSRLTRATQVSLRIDEFVL